MCLRRWPKQKPNQRERPCQKHEKKQENGGKPKKPHIWWEAIFWIYKDLITQPMKREITQLKNGKRLEHTNSPNNTYANVYMKRRTTH